MSRSNLVSSEEFGAHRAGFTVSGGRDFAVHQAACRSGFGRLTKHSLADTQPRFNGHYAHDPDAWSLSSRYVDGCNYASVQQSEK